MMVPRRVALCAGLAAVVFVLTIVSASAAEPTTVILVRHAEKQSDSRDPSLTEQGRERAASLARIVGHAGVSVILSSQFLRTRETVQPAAAALGIEVTVVPVEDAVRSSRKLAAQILERHSGRIVLVAGHSNTVPEIIKGLGADPPPPIGESQYDDLFIVTVNGEDARSLQLKY